MWPWIAVLLGWQGLVWLGQRDERLMTYAAAEQYAHERGKLMLLVGGPFGGGAIYKVLQMPVHGFGDVCLDLDPTACAGAPATTRLADIRSIPYPDKHFGAAFASHILEHLATPEDAQMALRELHRVADVVFVASPTKAALHNWIHPGHLLWVRQDADGRLEFEQR